MNATLTQNGWIKYYTCRTCKGQIDHYNHPKHPDYEIRIRVARNTARILNKNLIIAGPFEVYFMQKKLDEFIPKLTE